MTIEDKRWKVAQVTGKYYRWGNGGDFARNAINAGYQNLGRSPQPGSLAVMWGTPGHVAWVEGVSADGRYVTVSQYNYDYGAGYGISVESRENYGTEVTVVLPYREERSNG